MKLDFLFFIEAALLGFGLAMDAFSVSLANGLNEPGMKRRKILGIAGIFAFFQALMPMIGWVLVKTVVEAFGFIEVLIPWCALGLLGFIGAKMLIDSLHPDCDDERAEKGECTMTKPLTFAALTVQGVATSIDALSVGFTIAEYGVLEALVCAGVIALVTFPICLGGILIGRKFGSQLSNKAGILGGSILILIGLEIFITSWF
ncbi:MAG: manganese efflux pump [Clostridia bacterium]|nr:manganese efflux pump [Clostridia bacterium]